MYLCCFVLYLVSLSLKISTRPSLATDRIGFGFWQNIWLVVSSMRISINNRYSDRFIYPRKIIFREPRRGFTIPTTVGSTVSCSHRAGHSISDPSLTIATGLLVTLIVPSTPYISKNYIYLLPFPPIVLVIDLITVKYSIFSQHRPPAAIRHSLRWWTELLAIVFYSTCPRTYAA